MFSHTGRRVVSIRQESIGRVMRSVRLQLYKTLWPELGGEVLSIDPHYEPPSLDNRMDALWAHGHRLWSFDGGRRFQRQLAFEQLL